MEQQITELTTDLLNEMFEYRDEELFWKIRGKSRQMGKPVGSVNGDGYKRVKINRKLYAVHRLVWVMHGNDPVPFVDHIGVISGNASVVGDAAWNKWSGKYLRDEFGTYIQEDYEVTDNNGNTVIQQRRKLNPAFDPDAEYIPREQRPEWDCVGLMGKLRIRKGQVTSSRWIKMRDISDSVEEWLVR